MNNEEDLALIRDAFHGRLGDDLQVISGVGLGLVATLLRKNQDYGNSAFEVPMLAPGMTALQGI